MSVNQANTTPALCPKCRSIFDGISSCAGKATAETQVSGLFKGGYVIQGTPASNLQGSLRPPRHIKWTWTALDFSRGPRCDLCCRLRQLRTGFHVRVILGTINPTSPRPSLKNRFETSLDGFWTMVFASGKQSERFCMFPLTDESAAICKNYEPPTGTGDSAALDLVRFWMTHCLENHEACSKNLTPSVLPTRLLDVSDPTIVRLIETRDAGITDPYVTLSHSWGKLSNHLTLTSDNRQLLLRGLPAADLPLTFREAAVTTRNLGYRYIWIDSLCIIQSGAEAAADWAREVRTMAAVYRNCILNLAASDARNSSEGMFRQRDPTVIKPLCVDLPTAIVKREHGLHWNVSEASRPHVLMTSGLLDRGVGHFPLDTRAWVCQERLLSPRIAHFSKHQIIWECQCRPLSAESMPCGVDAEHTLVQTHGLLFAIDPSKPREHPLGDTDATSPSILRSPTGTWKAHDRIAQTQRWFDILTDYTTRNLTQATDKLPAIGAVAQWIGEELKDEYALGFFKSHLPHALLWQYKAKVTPSGGNGTTYIAPSWSWARTSQPINFEECFWMALARSQPNGLKGNTFAELVDIHADLVDRENLFGKVTAGHLTIRAPLVQIPPGTKPDVFKNRPLVRLDTLASGNHRLHFDDDVQPKSRIGDNVHLLPISWRMGHPGRAGGVPHMREFGLLLAEQADGSFSRLGIFQGSHVSSCAKTEEWGYKTSAWGYPKKMLREVRLV